jgi:hypothetical protein
MLIIITQFVLQALFNSTVQHPLPYWVYRMMCCLLGGSVPCQLCRPYEEQGFPYLVFDRTRWFIVALFSATSNILYTLFAVSDLLYSLWCRPLKYCNSAILGICSLAAYAFVSLQQYIHGKIYEFTESCLPRKMSVNTRQGVFFQTKVYEERNILCRKKQHLWKDFQWFVNICSKI